VILVLDASVALKWFFREYDDEADVDRALALIREIDVGRHRMVEPPHFLAEMAAGLARKKPAAARRDFRDLREMVWHIVDEAGVYEKAIELADRFSHHLFDTLYHASALTIPESVLVTADIRYYRKAKQARQICLLAEFVHEA
jgi:predicted nucleic acid-binding protein